MCDSLESGASTLTRSALDSTRTHLLNSMRSTRPHGTSTSASQP
nr:MAG TPA: hypothetical protein [Caudoviricetes sp.]